jgi:cyclopropane fatty-acyl-phospholipid synthase-like methyltransferase
MVNDVTIRSRIVRHFAKPSGVLGHMAGYIMANRSSNIERNRWTVELLKIAPDHRVLEVGCGPGLGLKAAAALLETGQVVGLDHSAVMLTHSERRLHNEIRRGTCRLQLGGLDELADSAEQYDRIYSANVVQFFPDKEQAFRVIYRILVDGGVVASTYQPRHKNPTRSDAFDVAGRIAEAMECALFVDIETHELPIDPVPAICVTAIKKQTRSGNRS